MALKDIALQNSQAIEQASQQLAEAGALVLTKLQALKDQIASGGAATEADLQSIIDSQTRALASLGTASAEMTQAES